MTGFEKNVDQAYTLGEWKANVARQQIEPEYIEHVRHSRVGGENVSAQSRTPHLKAVQGSDDSKYDAGWEIVR